jgi:ankyrin repeat protein
MHYEDFKDGKRGYAIDTLDRALLTPNLDTFDFVMGLKKKTQYPDLEKDQLLSLLHSACCYGWVEMAQRLLTLGAPLEDDGPGLWPSKGEDPLRAACRARPGHTTYSEAIVRLLLSHGARIKGDEVTLAAKTGKIGVVQALVEAGADVNKGDPHPLVSAIALERVDLFKSLLSWGAELNSEVRGACIERAKQENLESMLELLM